MTNRSTQKASAEKAVRDIRRATRKRYSAEEKIRIVLEGLRGEDSIAELCRRGVVPFQWTHVASEHPIHQSSYVSPQFPSPFQGQFPHLLATATFRNHLPSFHALEKTGNFTMAPWPRAPVSNSLPAGLAVSWWKTDIGQYFSPLSPSLIPSPAQ